MGIFDKAKEALSEHSDHIDTGIERAGDMVDEKTGGKYAEHVDTGQDFAASKLREFADGEPGAQPPRPSQPEQTA